MVRVSDYIAAQLERIGVTHIFLLSGGGMMHLQDAVFRHPRLRYICANHEQSCAYAAEAYARARGELGVCYATSGPGGANTVTGVIQAWLDSSPVLFITGQAKASETIRGTGLLGLRQFGTFEVDIVPIVASVTKYAVFLDDPSLVRYHLEKAIAIAREGRPGPVLLDIPLNVQGALIDPETLRGYDDPPPPPPAPSPAAIDDIIARLRRARRPLILAGHGIRAAGEVDRFRALVPRLNIPVATTQLANDLLPYEAPLYVGHPGVKGDRPGGFAVQNADCILTIGCSLHAMTTGYELDQFAPQAEKIQVDLDPMVLRRANVGVTTQLQASIRALLDALDARLTAQGAPVPLHPTGPWHQRCATWKRELAVRREPHPHPEGQLNYYDVIDALSDLSRDDAILVADAGSAFYITGQAYRCKGTQRVILAGALAQMGYTTSATIGASIACPDRPVIGITGDGSFQSNIHDLGVLAYHQLDVTLVVVNNGGYVSIRNTQHNYFGGKMDAVDAATGVFMPDLRRIAEAYGIPYLMAETAETLRPTMAQALATRGPVLLEVRTAYHQEIIPSVMSQRLPDGRMRSRPIHDMTPLMTPEALQAQMDTDR